VGIIKDTDKMPVTKENVLAALRKLSSSERSTGQAKIPVVSVMKEKIDGGWLPETIEELEDAIGIVGEYKRILGRYEMAREIEEMVNALIALEEKD
jgi:hypothetical protein